MKDQSYHTTRLAYDKKRNILWVALVDFYFQNLIKPESTVLELGAGYCDFINNIKARKKYALDLWDGIKEYAQEDVTVIHGYSHQLDSIPDTSIDLVFASNLFEHITKEDFDNTLKHIQLKLKPTGLLVILQPNFRYAYKEYFDDFTHVSIWSDKSLQDFLESKNFRCLKVYPKFLPLSIKSRFPVHPLLIKLYLKFPLKILAKQMLLIAAKKI